MNANRPETDNGAVKWIALGVGWLLVVWVSVLIAQALGGGLPVMIPALGDAFSHPFRLTWCDKSLPCLLVLSLIYGVSLLVYHYTKPSYRRREEHGSAVWGSIREIDRKYRQQPDDGNKVMTQHVAIGYDAHAHRRNLNTLVIGGSGAGKTRFYAKPNILQANTSFVITDPKGEILRDTGYLLEAKG